MNELFENIKGFLGERSPIWRVFVTSFVVWNWRIIFTLFFADEAVLGSPKVELVFSYLLVENSDVWGNIANWVLLIVPPILITYLLIQYFPALHNWAFRRATIHKYDKKEIDQEERVSYEKRVGKAESAVAEALKAQADAREAQRDAKKKISEATTEEDGWLIEYRSLTSRLENVHFRKIVEKIYEEGGSFRNTGGKKIDGLGLAFLDTHGLINIGREDYTADTVSLTEKGKFFARMTLETNPISDF